MKDLKIDRRTVIRALRAIEFVVPDDATFYSHIPISKERETDCEDHVRLVVVAGDDVPMTPPSDATPRPADLAAAFARADAALIERDKSMAMLLSGTYHWILAKRLRGTIKIELTAVLGPLGWEAKS